MLAQAEEWVDQNRAKVEQLGAKKDQADEIQDQLRAIEDQAVEMLTQDDAKLDQIKETR